MSPDKVYLALAVGVPNKNWRNDPNPGPRQVYKIGCSGDPQARIKSLKYVFGGDWTLVDWFPGDLKMEHAIHRRLRHLHSPYSPPLFREYYRRAAEVRNFFQRVKERGI